MDDRRHRDRRRAPHGLRHRRGPCNRATVVARGTILDPREAMCEPDALERASEFEATEYAEAASFPITVYTFELSEVYQGSAITKPVMEVMQIGTPADISELEQTLETGSEHVLFLPDDPEIPHPVGIVGGPTGTFAVQGDQLVSQAAARSGRLSAGHEHPVVPLTWDELAGLPAE
ncbi:hypothetical protein [Agrococcus baldri]|nr:hypothetical protein [Agrococcus baldri]